MAAGAPVTVLFGTGGRFTAGVLEGLVAAGLRPAVLVLPGPGDALYVQAAPAAGSSVAAAERHRVPVIHLPPGDGAGVAARLATLAPALGVMACFPRRLPLALAELPRWGTLNLHPSPLPRDRGPAPLFWQLRDGAHTLWLTVHRVVEELDAGAVVARLSRPLPAGADGAVLDERLAAMGAAAVAGVVRAHPEGGFPAEDQDPASATTQSWPGPADFRIDPAGPARAAYGFIRGTAHWQLPYRVAGPGAPPALAEAIAYRPGGRLSAPWLAAGDTVRLQCGPGILRARLAAVQPGGRGGAQ